MRINRIAFQVGRRIGKHPLAGWLFCLCERLLPLNRLARQEGLVAFHHPRPTADPHVLIVPTRPVSSLTSDRLADKARAQLLWNMIELAQKLTPQLPESDCWQLVINGGSRQDIGQLHGHLLHASDGLTDVPREGSLPGSGPTVWQEVFDELRKADQVPDDGFSLIFHWKSQGPITAVVT